MNILITGGTGFIGRSLVRRLLLLGHGVHVVLSPRARTEVFQHELSSLGVSVYDGTLNSLVAAVERATPDITFHLASLFLVQHKAPDVDNLIASNVLFPTQLLEALDHTGRRNFVNTGTSWQHYNDELYNPVNLYAATKQAFEQLLEYYVQARGFRAITLKLYDSYGPGDRRPKLFSLLRNAARNGAELRMSAGEQTIDPIYIDDIVDAFVTAGVRVTAIQQKETFGVTSGAPVRLRDLAELYGKVVGRTLDIKWGESNGGLPYRPREVMTAWKDPAVLPGWSAKIGLIEGITQMEKDPEIGGLLS